MRLAYFSIALASLAAIAPLAPASAQTAGGAVQPGMLVVDPNGGVVGAVTSVAGDSFIVKTDRLEAAIAVNSVTPHEGKLLFGMTQAELNAETEQSIAAANAAIAPGATVAGAAGVVVGRIDSIDSDFATLKLESGESVRVPRSGLAAGGGGVVIGVTAEQLKAQLDGSSAE